MPSEAMQLNESPQKLHRLEMFVNSIFAISNLFLCLRFYLVKTLFAGAQHDGLVIIKVSITDYLIKFVDALPVHISPPCSMSRRAAPPEAASPTI